MVRPAKYDSWRTDAAKDWREDMEKAGRTVLIPDQLDQIRGMARSLAAHPLVKAGVLNGGIELSMFWKDEETGVWLKSRPDSVPNASGDFADLKATDSVLDFALRQKVGNFGYYAQGALVCEGAYRLVKYPTTTFSLVFVEYDPPYCARVVTLPEADLLRGEKQNHIALRLFKRCLDANEWPGPGNADAEVIGLGDEAAKRLDARLERMEGA